MQDTPSDLKDLRMSKDDIRREGMRIGGETVYTDAVVEVRYPYTDKVIGTVPAGTADHARTLQPFPGVHAWFERLRHRAGVRRGLDARA